MKNALLEIGCEEIPARFMPAILADLKAKAQEKISFLRLKFKDIQTLGTYRRIVLYVEGLQEQQDDIVEEIKGPPKKFALGNDGKLSQAAIGFVKKQGVSPDAITFRLSGKEEYAFAHVKRAGRAASVLLSSLFPEILSSLHLPVSMRWGGSDTPFIRPVHWILALFGASVVKFDFAGIKSGSRTFGHRFFGPANGSAFNLKKEINLLTYKKTLAGLSVMVDPAERKNLIAAKIKDAAKKIPSGKAKAIPLIEDDLLEEVNFLVEAPEAAPGEFNPDFLKLPKEVLITSMKKNQKYFPVLGSRGELLPYFIIIADGTQKKDIADVVLGNKRVITARLSDAEFFFKEDKKIPLEKRVGSLKKVAYYEKLGTLYDKKERIKALSDFIIKELKLPDEVKRKAERAAELCKADLVTQMVFEFPTLQGVMGREYALSSGEDAEVAEAIFEHCLPRFSGDKLPSALPGTIVSLADKFDSIAGCFCINLIPTGSADPFGLRRHAHGIIQIILGKNLDLSLEDVIDKCHKLYVSGIKDVVPSECGAVSRDILSFLAQRIKIMLLEEGIRHDIADASLALFNNILDVKEKAHSLTKLLGSQKLKGVVLTADRISRIAKAAERENIIEADLAEEGEKSLHALYLKINWAVGEAVNKGNYAEAIDELSKLTDPVEKFFEDILVMHEDEKLKLNRLALLKNLERMYLEVADFTKIVM